jgi:hypothetical protein
MLPSPSLHLKLNGKRGFSSSMKFYMAVRESKRRFLALASHLAEENEQGSDIPPLIQSNSSQPTLLYFSRAHSIHIIYMYYLYIYRKHKVIIYSK